MDRQPGQEISAPEPQDQERWFDVSGYMPVLSFAVLFTGLYVASHYSYPLFHSLAESFSIIVACAVFILAWNSRNFIDNRYFLFLGVAYLFVGFLDLIHTLAYEGMNVFPGASSNLPIQLWIAARYLESISLLVALNFLRRRLNVHLLMACYALVTALLIASIFYWRIFPLCHLEDTGLTTFKKASEYVICLILLLFAALLIWNRREFDKHVLRLLIASACVTVCSELAFTAYVGLYDLPNLIGHLLKIISFYLIYKAIIQTGLVRPYNLLFRNLKQSEERVRAERDFQQQLLSTAATAIFTVDAQKWITGVNREFQNITGYSKEEVVGKPCTILGDDLCKQTCDLFGEEPATTVSKKQCVIRAKDGRRLTVIKNADVLRDESGQPKGAIESFVDVTELAEAREAAEGANRAKSAFLANMSHELKTPLTAILGFCELIRHEAAGPLNDEQKSSMDSIHRSGQHLLSLISDLLDLAKVEVGKVEIDLEPIDLAFVIEWTLPFVHEKAVANRTELRSDVPENLPLVKANERAVRQIMLNLLTNAIKFSPDGGEVSIVARRDGSRVVVDVEDTGIGIAPEEIEKIFDPFERSSRQQSQQIEGTGLGLPLVRGLLTAMDGEISVKSEPGKGSCFTFTLPVVPAENS